MADAREVEAQAALFALGSLPEAEAAQFRKRVQAGCPLCSGLLEECERVLTAVAVSVPQAEPPAGLRERLLRGVQGEPEPPVQTVAQIVRDGQTPWMPAQAPGVEYRALRGRNTVMLRMGPNTWYPEHRHVADEQCLVVEGAVTSEGVTVHAGDYVFMPKGSLHAPLYSEMGCVLLIAYT